MSHQLSRGAIHAMYTNTPYDNPTVQVIDTKQIQAPSHQATQPERYRLIISDGLHYYPAMLATQLNPLVREGTISNLCVIRLKEYISNNPSPNTSKRVVIILNVEIVSGSTGATIGSPVNIETSVGSTPAAPAPATTPAPYQPLKHSSVPAHHHAPPVNAPTSTSAPPQNSYNRGAPAPYKTPVHSNPPASMGGMGGGGGSGGSGVIYPIKSLNPYQNRWTIKARIISKSEIRKWSNPKSSGKLFSIDLVDSEGGEIRATMFNNACDKFYNVLEVDKVYQISKGVIKPANKTYSSVKNDYELTLDENAIIELCNDASGAIPRVHYSFVPLSNIADCPKDTIIDVVGIVSETGEVSSIKSKAGSDLIKRNITLLDMTARTIELTLWGNSAQNIAWNPAEHPVLALRGTKVSDFNGKSLGTLSSTIMQVNPDLTEAHQLRAWYDHQGGHVEAYPLTQKSTYGGGGDAGSRGEKAEDRKTFAQVKEENMGSRSTDYFVNKATITMIKHDGPVNLWYTACPTPDCNKKVIEVNVGEWRCDKCGQTFTTCNYRYILSFSAADHTGSQWLSCFNEIADKVLGKDAATMAKMKEENPQAFEAVFQEATFKQYKFRIRAKMESYNDETKVRLSVVKAEPLNFVQESRHLLSLIQHYS